MKKSAKAVDWDQWRQFWRLANDRKPLCLANLDPRTTAFGFSARLWWSGRGAQTWQQFVHPASHLLRSRQAVLVFPRTQFGFHQIASQHQMIMHHSDNVAPALKLLWGPQARLLPHQCLFVKAIAMLLPKAQHIAQGDLSEIGRRVTEPHEPTHARITLLVGRMRSHHTQNRDLQPASMFDMHALPPGDFHRTTFLIGTTPRAIWLAMRRRILRLQFGSIFAWSTFLARWGRCHTVEAAIANDPAQHPNAQPATTTPQPGGIVAPVQRHQRVGWGVGKQAHQLCVSHFNRRCPRCHPLLIQDVRPTTGGDCQSDQGRKLPPKRDRFLAFRQVMHVLRGSICRSDRIWTRNTTGIDSDPEPFPRSRLGQVARKNGSQVLFIDAPIFERFIQTWPFALKPQRLRDFRERCGLRFGHQGIYGIEQGILRSWKTVIEIVTKLSQCVNVFQTSKLPLLFSYRNFT